MIHTNLFQLFWITGKRRLVKLAYRKPKVKLYYMTEGKWDYLIILDACRFDTFKKCNNLPGRLYKIVSSGTCTGEWIRSTFNKPLKDVVYVSANPNISHVRLRQLVGHNPFYKIIEVWKDFWTEELGTTHPSTVNEATLVSLKIHRGKRHIIHYMQPHYPYIGDIRITDPEWLKAHVRVRKMFAGLPTVWKMLRAKQKKGHPVWKMVRARKISVDVVRKAYESNLKLVLEYVKSLLPHLKGRVYITSDHGELFGEYGFYGHPQGIYVPELLHVPLLEIDNTRE